MEGEFFRGWSLSEEDVSSELLNMLINVRPGRLWSGEFFREWSLSEEDVSFELLNMLLDVRLGRW